MKLLDFDNMLYPQYEDSFEKTISVETWENLQEQAKKNLASKDFATDGVRNHWQSIVDGKVPFGFIVKK